MLSKVLLTHFCLAALLTSSSYAAESTFNYEVIAQPGMKIDGISPTYFDTVAMNDLDTVIFEAGYNDGSYAGAAGVFSRNYALLKKGDVVRGLTVGRPSICGINDFDELGLTFSYGIGFSSALGKFVRHGQSIVPEGKLVKTGDVIDGLTIQSFRDCKINDAGEIVFAANYVDSSGNTHIGVFNRNKVLLQYGSQVQGIPLSGNNSLNTIFGLSDFGTVTFDSITQSGAFTQHKVLALSGQTVDQIPLLAVFFPVISHFGRVAFSGEYAIQPNCNSYSCMGFAAFGPGGIAAKTGDTISGLTLTNSVNTIGINDDGKVLMQANFAGGYGLFTQDSVVAATGDTIGGIPLSGFVNGQINDFGDVAFSSFEAIILARHKNVHQKRK